MSLSYAILASLTESECSGYDLAKRFDTSVGFFWSATHQQIYKELRKLQQLGWVEAEEVSQEGRPDKKVFSITHKGEENLREWIVQPSSISPTKEEILVKLFAGHLVPKETIIQQVRLQRHLHEEQLKVFRAIQGKYFQDISSCETALQLQYLTLRRGIRFEEDWIEWCDEVMNFLSI
jgi:DNA-binding PadR family transcriptional regulator